jgi:hypothetical protein
MVGVVFLLVLLAIAGVVLVVVLASKFDEINKRNLASDREAQQSSVAWLRTEREAVRLRSDIEHMKAQAELRPLVLETKKAILQGRADKRLLDAVFARRALDDVLGMGSQSRENDPIEAAAGKLLTEIENRKADGEATDDLEAALSVLRTMSGRAA